MKGRIDDTTYHERTGLDVEFYSAVMTSHTRSEGDDRGDDEDRDIIY